MDEASVVHKPVNFTVALSLLQTQDPAGDLCFPQEAALVGPPPLVAVEASINSQEPLLVSVATFLIFPRAGPISHPDKTLQEGPLLPYPTHLDLTRASSLVGAHLHRHSLEDPGQARLLDLLLLMFHRGGTDLSLPRQEAPQLGRDRDFLHLLIHPQTTADLPYRPLLGGGLHFLTTDPHLHQLLWEVIGHLCPVMCPLLLPLSTPNPPLPLPPLLLVPQLVGVHPLSRRAGRALLLSHPPRLEETTTAPHVCPKGTAHSTATGQLRHMLGQDLSLRHQTRDRLLLEGTSPQYAQGLFLPLLPQGAVWVGPV